MVSSVTANAHINVPMQLELLEERRHRTAGATVEPHKLGTFACFDREYRSTFFDHEYRSIANYRQYFSKKKVNLYSNKYGKLF